VLVRSDDGYARAHVATATPTTRSSNSETIRNHAALIWSVADLLRSDYEQSEHQVTFNGTLALTSDIGEVRSFFGEGQGTDVDKLLLLDQFEESWLADGELSDQAQNNSIENFRLVFDRKFLQTVIARVDANDEIYKKILDDEDFRATLGEFYLRKVYDRLREAPGMGA